MRIFYVAFGLIFLGFVFVNTMIPKESCIAIPLEVAVPMFRCIAGFLLLGLFGTLVTPNRIIMGYPKGLLIFVYVILLLGLFVFGSAGMIATPENVANCTTIFGNY